MTIKKRLFLSNILMLIIPALVSILIIVVSSYVVTSVFYKQLMDESVNGNNLRTYTGMKLSITLDTLTARILKLSSDSQSGIEPTPFYSWWNPADCRADPAVAPVAHKISPDHRF